MLNRRLLPLTLMLSAAGLLALVQQQVLLRRPGRLVAVESVPALGPGVPLTFRFSRAVQPEVALTDAGGRVIRRLTVRGQERRWRLDLTGEPAIEAPLRLRVSGRDAAGRPIRPRRLVWDPRPALLARVSRGSAERLELREPDGRWHPLTPWSEELSDAWPLADGAGVLYATDAAPLRARAWRVAVEQNRLWDPQAPRPPLRVRPPRDLLGASSTFVHASSSATGRLLVQGASLQPQGAASGSDAWLRLQESNGRGWRDLPFASGGAATLLPTGDGVIVPVADGLTLHTLPPLAEGRRFLPGRRDLLAFCGLGERAVMLARQADFTRTVALLRPGEAPVRLWSGRAAVVGASCSADGERVWLLTVDQDRDGSHQLALQTLQPGGAGGSRFPLEDWRLGTGTSLSFDPVSRSLLATLSPVGGDETRAVLIALDGEGTPREVSALPRPLLQAAWLPARGRIGGFSALF
ncbi:hypothetical protein EVJ50_11465 [Synechococcus sp. RSCCF101]|uniref:hypothetical protein n=1 Tax=Synechococcus sp. RSCCF101 TaxID=2511069 RepID=UPI0012445819|nr:hypothetical protein [Synechococcus sp. RSCCF101]QEY32751.1 hypothetical protein EVJ50_11465 [Synechococcus sp. RSCCF101]